MKFQMVIVSGEEKIDPTRMSWQLDGYLDLGGEKERKKEPGLVHT